MVKQGHEVTMVTSSSRLPEKFGHRLFVDDDVDGIRVRSVRVPYSNYMGYTRRLWSFLTFTIGATYLALTSGKHDVVFATSTPLTVGIPGWLSAAISRTPFVFEVRDLWPEAAIQMGAIRRNGLIARIAKWLERFLYRHAAAVVALSPGMVAGVIAEGVPAERVHMIPNSADLDLFFPQPKDETDLERFGLGARFVVGYAGAIGPSNAVEAHVPRAARELAARGRDDIVFLIAGDGKNMPALREATKELSNVVLLGPVPKSEVPRVTRASDALMTLFADVPILATNSPNKLFDALASGRPVIVNQRGWMRQLIEENEAGCFIPAGDGVALADAIEVLADNPASTAAMGQAARQLAESTFARDLQASRLISVLEKAAGRVG